MLGSDFGLNQDAAPASNLYSRIKASGLTGSPADEFTGAIEANMAGPGEKGYGLHNRKEDFVNASFYPHGSEDGNQAMRELFQASPAAHEYLTGEKSPPLPWGTYVGARYDQAAGQEALAQGRDLGSLTNQVEAKESLNRVQQGLDGYADAMNSLEDQRNGDGASDGVKKLMDFSPDPMGKQENPAAGDLGEIGKKMQDQWNQPDAPGAGDYKPLEDGIKDIGERVDQQIGLNGMQDQLDEKKVVWVGGKAYPWNEVYEEVDSAPADGVWEYNNRTGVLSRNGQEVYKDGYSGKGPGWNNPDMIDKKKVGPIPNGIYEMSLHKPQNFSSGPKEA